MDEQYHFKITRYCPREEIFDGMMTFAEAHKFMDEHASFERRVGFQVFNDKMNRWEDFGDSYHGGRKVYDKRGNLNIIDPDYRSMWSPWNCGWYIWEVSQGRRFIISLGTKEKAEEACKKYQEWHDSCNDGLRFVVEESDVHDDTTTATIR
jgi:hypothetical protein